MASHIELLGIPGSGKTTLAPTLITQLRLHGFKALNAKEAVVAAARADERDWTTRQVVRVLPPRWAFRSVERSYQPFLGIRDMLLHHPDWGSAVMEITRRRQDLEPQQDRVLSWTLQVGWHYAIWRRHPVGPLVFDEGFAQRVVALLGYRFGRGEGDSSLLEDYVRAIPAPDLVVRIDTDPDAVHRRGGVPDRFAFLDGVSQMQYLRDVSDCVMTASDLLTRRGVDVRVVRNDGNLHDARSEVAAVVSSWVAETDA